MSNNEIQKRTFSDNLFCLAKEFTLGTVASVVALFCAYPIDVAKFLAQNTPKGTEGMNLRQKLSHRYSSGGIPAFYRGYPVNALGVGPEKGIKLGMSFFFDRLIQDHVGVYKIRDDTPIDIILLHFGISGGLGGGFQTIFSSPLELVKIQRQNGNYKLKVPYLLRRPVELYRFIGDFI